MKITKKTIFDKKDCWDTINFYTIFFKGNTKYIRFTCGTDRVSEDKRYLSWKVQEYPDSCIIELQHFLDFNIYYQLENLIDNINIIEYICTPQKAFEIANKYVKGINGNGSINLDLFKITMETECNDYYGI